jgi:hypothetical protein
MFAALAGNVNKIARQQKLAAMMIWGWRRVGFMGS